MSEDHNHHIERHIRFALITLGLILVILFVFLAAQYQSLRAQQILNAREMRLSQLLQHHAPLPVLDAGIIRSWMTFDYVNKLFALPSDYLKNSLQITDPHYPRLTIGTVRLSEVENAVRVYAVPQVNTSTVQSGTSI